MALSFAFCFRSLEASMWMVVEVCDVFSVG